LEEAGVVGDGGDESAAAGLVGGRSEEGGGFGRFGGDEESGFASEDVGEALCFFGGNMEVGIGHAKGGEEISLEVVGEGLSGSGFDDAGEDVGVDAIDPAGFGLVEQGDVGQKLGHFSEGMFPAQGFDFLVKGIDWMGRPAVGKSGSVAKEVADGGGGLGFDGVTVFLPDPEVLKLGEIF
jgi:hypothetical protein